LFNTAYANISLGGTFPCMNFVSNVITCYYYVITWKLYGQT